MPQPPSASRAVSHLIGSPRTRSGDTTATHVSKRLEFLPRKCAQSLQSLSGSVFIENHDDQTLICCLPLTYPSPLASDNRMRPGCAQRVRACLLLATTDTRETGNAADNYKTPGVSTLQELTSCSEQFKTEGATTSDNRLASTRYRCLQELLLGLAEPSSLLRRDRTLRFARAKRELIAESERPVCLAISRVEKPAIFQMHTSRSSRERVASARRSKSGPLSAMFPRDGAKQDPTRDSRQYAEFSQHQ